MRDTKPGRGLGIAGVLLRVLVSALVIAPISAWSALALWFRLPGPEATRAAAAVLFAILGLATIAALFTRRSLVGIIVFASAFAFEVYVLDPWEEPKENCRWLIRHSTYDIAADRIWDNINKGVCLLHQSSGAMLIFCTATMERHSGEICPEPGWR